MGYHYHRLRNRNKKTKKMTIIQDTHAKLLPKMSPPLLVRPPKGFLRSPL